MRKPFVAIVDDDSAFANYLRTFLSLRGYETRSYLRGDEMIAAVKQGDPPDLVGIGSPNDDTRFAHFRNDRIERGQL